MLCQEDTKVKHGERIPAINEIEKFEKQLHKERDSKKKQELTQQTSKSTTAVGYISKNNQENCGLTGKEGTHAGQKLYQMKCQKCGYVYEANGCDIWLRKCPRCQA